MIITLEQLKELNACSDEVVLFEKLFGQRVRMTKALCLKHAADFDFEWAAISLLSAPAWDNYQRATAAAWAAHDKAVAAVWDRYNESRKRESVAWAKYEKIMAALDNKSETIMALAFWRASRIKAAA